MAIHKQCLGVRRCVQIPDGTLEGLLALDNAQAARSRLCESKRGAGPRPV
jgi:hypothetical protein